MMSIRSLAANLIGSTVLAMSLQASAAITPFSDDFESYNQADDNAFGSSLLDATYFVIGFVTAGTGGIDYEYGLSRAPNSSAAGTPDGFSAIATGEGGVTQGAQQLSVFSDYTNGDHGIPAGNIQSTFFREYSIDPANVGETWRFSFDAKMGDLIAPSTASAFLKILDPITFFSQTAIVSEDMTTIAGVWQRYTIDIVIDAAWVGQVLQFGFDNNATNFDPSGVFYDNIVFELVPAGCVGNGTDTDGDGIDDNCDNCSVVFNDLQQDTDADGFGNVCDGDFDNNCLVSGVDLGIFKAAFFTADPLTDMDSSGLVTGVDLGLFKAGFFNPPGPNGADVADACP